MVLLPMTLEQDVHELQQLVAFLDGWRQGETERYDRLERDVAGIKVEFQEFRREVNQRFSRIDQRFSQMDQRFGQIDQHWTQVNTRIDRLLWFMIATLGSVLVQMAIVILTR